MSKQPKWDWENMAVRLREQRTARGITQAVLAERVGVTVGYISHIEGGDSTPALDMFFNIITDGLKMSLAEFFRVWPGDEEAERKRIREESRDLFNKYIGHDIFGRGIHDYLTMIEEAQRKRRKQS